MRSRFNNLVNARDVRPAGLLGAERALPGVRP